MPNVSTKSRCNWSELLLISYTCNSRRNRIEWSAWTTASEKLLPRSLVLHNKPDVSNSKTLLLSWQNWRTESRFRLIEETTRTFLIAKGVGEVFRFVSPVWVIFNKFHYQLKFYLAQYKSLEDERIPGLAIICLSALMSGYQTSSPGSWRLMAAKVCGISSVTKKWLKQCLHWRAEWLNFSQI